MNKRQIKTFVGRLVSTYGKPDPILLQAINSDGHDVIVIGNKHNDTIGQIPNDDPNIIELLDQELQRQELNTIRLDKIKTVAVQEEKGGIVAYLFDERDLRTILFHEDDHTLDFNIDQYFTLLESIEEGEVEPLHNHGKLLGYKLPGLEQA